MEKALIELRGRIGRDFGLDGSKKALLNKVLLLAIEYVSDTFYEVDDFRKEFSLRSKKDPWSESFMAMINRTNSDLNRSDFRKAFSRLISWRLAEEGKIYRAHDHAWSGRLQGICCQILMEFGTLDDALKISERYGGLISTTSFVKKIDEAVFERNEEVSRRLLGSLVSFDPKCLEISRLTTEVNRLEKILCLEKNNINTASIDELSGLEFELLLARIFEQLGFKVLTTSKTGDYGSDLIVTTPRETKISVQCKRFKCKVNLKAVQEVVASLSHYQCDYGLVITNNTFLNSAKKLAAHNEVELWDKDCLMNFLLGDISFSELRNL